MSTKAQSPQLLEFAAGYGTCVAVAVPIEVVLVYDEPERTTEEVSVPVGDADEVFHRLLTTVSYKFADFITCPVHTWVVGVH